MNIRDYTVILHRVLHDLRRRRGGQQPSSEEIRQQLRAEIVLLMQFSLRPDQIKRDGGTILEIVDGLYLARTQLTRERFDGLMNDTTFAERLNDLFDERFALLRLSIAGNTYVDLVGISYSESVRLVDPESVSTERQVAAAL